MFADTPPPIVSCAAQDGLDAQAALDAAHAARLAGDYAAAQCAAQAALSADPRNADAWLELGLIHAASGDAPKARAAFTRALDIAPDYDDARFGLAQLAYRAGDVDGARAWLRQIDADRKDPEIETLRRSLAGAETRRSIWRWDAAAAYSTLSNDLAPWREASLSLSRRDGDVSLGVGVEHVDRFGETDLYGEVRAARVVRGVVWGAALGGASEAVFKPEIAARVEFATREDADWVFDGSLSLARYRVGDIDRLALRAERKLGAAARVSAQAIVVRDEAGEYRNGYSVAAAWRPRDRLELSLSWTDAPESSEGATIDVRAIGFGATIDVAPDTRVRFGALREEREAFDRTEFSIAVSRTF
jgi:YaiO family outer membrane protein